MVAIAFLVPPVAITVKVWLPPTVGVPEISPVALLIDKPPVKVSPAGKL